MVITNPRLAFQGLPPQQVQVAKIQTIAPEKTLQQPSFEKLSTENLKAYFLPTFTANETQKAVDKTIKAMKSDKIKDFSGNIKLSGPVMKCELSFKCEDELYKINYTLEADEKGKVPVPEDNTSLLTITNLKTNNEQSYELTGQQLFSIIKLIKL